MTYNKLDKKYSGIYKITTNKLDGRYSINLEYCGYKEPHYVARFCDEYLGCKLTKSDATIIALEHRMEFLEGLLK
tara:strand:+ start:1181 stop:1405 length:225 start_codon:yes stop_codon:yes gene_type:complete